MTTITIVHGCAPLQPHSHCSCSLCKSLVCFLCGLAVVVRLSAQGPPARVYRKCSVQIAQARRVHAIIFDTGTAWHSRLEMNPSRSVEVWSQTIEGFISPALASSPFWWASRDLQQWSGRSPSHAFCSTSPTSNIRGPLDINHHRHGTAISRDLVDHRNTPRCARYLSYHT